MSKQRTRLLRYPEASIPMVFGKEAELLGLVQAGELDQSLILWRAKTPTLVLPAGRKWQISAELDRDLSRRGWQLFTRKTGGAPVPQTSGVINLSHMYCWPENQQYSIVKAYENLCTVLDIFLTSYGLKSEVHATPFAYCDGDYNLNIHGKKIIGTAQRVVLRQGGGHVVLAQACILIDTLLEQLVEPVNVCYEHHGDTHRVRADVHTALFENMDERPSTEALFLALQRAFITSGLY